MITFTNGVLLAICGPSKLRTLYWPFAGFEIQLSSYAYAYRHATGAKEGQLQIRRLIKTKNPQIETHKYSARTDVHFGRLFALIREYLDALDSGRFNFRPGWGCSMCEHRDAHCRRWCG